MERGALWLAHSTWSWSQTSILQSQHSKKTVHIVLLISLLKMNCTQTLKQRNHQNKLNQSNMPTILSQISQLSPALNAVKPATSNKRLFSKYEFSFRLECNFMFVQSNRALLMITLLRTLLIVFTPSMYLMGLFELLSVSYMSHLVITAVLFYKRNLITSFPSIRNYNNTSQTKSHIQIYIVCAAMSHSFLLFLVLTIWHSS